MEFIKIKTPLNVNVDIRHAGVGRRLVAFLIDMFLIFVYLWAMSYFFFSVLNIDFTLFDEKTDSYFDLVAFYEILYMILLLPAICYSLWTEMIFNGQTFGKMIMGIRVVKINGYRAGFPEYFTRWVFRFVDFWTGLFMLLFLIPIFGEERAYILAWMMFMMSGFVAFFSIIRTKNSQRIGDIVAGTTVLKLKEKESIRITILEDIRENYVPRYSQVVKLTDNDARIIKDTFVHAKKRKDYKTIKRLRDKLESVMEIKSDQNDWDFVDTVMKDFNYYTQKM
ncbi:MAG: RDD family protein [Flavobacteriia bacterium]|nr:RDD family protein [Flavobacteriia bacterium]